MNRFVIVDGLPYLYANGKTYAVRWDEAGFTVGAEVELDSVPTATYSEPSVKAKCAGQLDSIGEPEDEESEDEDTDADTESEDADAESESVVEESEEMAPEQDLESMTVNELKEYAAANNIELTGAKTKAEIIEMIKADSVE